MIFLSKWRFGLLPLFPMTIVAGNPSFVQCLASFSWTNRKFFTILDHNDLRILPVCKHQEVLDFSDLLGHGDVLPQTWVINYWTCVAQ